MLSDVVPDREQIAHLVEQELIVHGGEFARLLSEPFNQGDPLSCPESCQRLAFEVGQFPQRWNRAGHLGRREKRQLIDRILALAD